MIAPDAAFLDALAACAGAGVPLSDALSRIEITGLEGSRWAKRIRPFVQPGAPIESALHAARVLDTPERALLARAVTPEAMERLLHALALRRRRRNTLHRTIVRGLIGPFAIAALTVVLDPLPNLIGSGPYLAPVFFGLVVLGLLAALVVAGVPAALRAPKVGSRILAVCARVPGLGALASLHAEAELVTVTSPFAAGAESVSEGMLAASAMLGWSPLGERVRVAAQTNAASAEPPLVRLARYLSPETNLSILRGLASNQLPAQLAARGDEIAADLAARLRLTVRVTAYTLVVVLSFGSLAGMMSRALPGMPLLPGATPSTEQKELEEIMKELEGTPGAPAPSK